MMMMMMMISLSLTLCSTLTHGAVNHMQVCAKYNSNKQYKQCNALQKHYATPTLLDTGVGTCWPKQKINNKQFSMTGFINLLTAVEFTNVSSLSRQVATLFANSLNYS